jgi:two-component system, sensor histidine kinase and response regulator
MKTAIINFWEKLSRLGIDEETSLYDTKRIIVLNRLNFLGSIVSLIWFIYSFRAQNYYEVGYILPLVSSLPLLLSISLFYIMSKKKPKVTFIAATLLFPALQGIIGMLILADSALMFHISLSVLPFFFYSRFKSITWAYLYNVVCHLVAWAYIHHQEKGEDIFVMITFHSFAFILLYSMLYSIKKQISSYETSLQKRKAELNTRNEELHTVLKLKDKILAVISHDVKTPLTSLKLLLTNLNINSISQAELKQFNEMLLSETTKTLELFDNLLEWSKAELNEAALEKSNINAFQLTDVALRPLSTKAQQKNLKLVNNVQMSHSLYACASSIQTVVRNLVGNAIKFTPASGTIVISSSASPQSVFIHVKDNGIGMDEKTFRKVMGDGFYTSKGTMNEEGHGFGLKICHEFIKQNNGKLSCKSKVNEGTEFIIELPASVNKGFYLSEKDKKVINMRKNTHNEYPLPQYNHATA